jgi:hypothetical protein
LNVMHVVAEVSPHPIDEVERDIRKRMTHMSGVIGGNPTDVHLRRGRWSGWPNGLGSGVVQIQ